MHDIPITITGNITKTPTIQYLQSGAAVLRMTVASTPQYYSKAEQGYVDGETTYMPIELRSAGSTKHNDYIERQADIYRSGDRVIVTGKLVTRSRPEGDDTKRWNVVMVDEMGPSSRFADIEIKRPHKATQSPSAPAAPAAPAANFPTRHLPSQQQPPLRGYTPES
ncbi:single-stranded DNA-binding protein [Rothia sp. ZJ932]|uniref:single-stranded DNA-binding protein n=1 Tax=Rothia sp. ZJ932 TaxID=2810516 RepID=UPI001967AF17|nr:single-stranded DNA-binding protein [Rothia sp. ZJ932]QRZ61806.1 single-stranded DNA-binding protein [Rothia sp. ZJ932]